MHDWRLPWDGRLPLRAGAAPGDGAAARHHGLPLHGLPADERQRLLAVSAAIPAEGSR